MSRATDAPIVGGGAVGSAIACFLPGDVPAGL